MNNILKVDSILEYYDNPQLFTARDCFDTLYLCLMYEDFPCCKYTAIRISTHRMEQFYSGSVELRTIFLEPEGEREYFEVIYDNNVFVLSLTPSNDISEEQLPASGYKMTENAKESMIVNIPVKDKGLFTELVKKFCWACM